MMKSSAKKSVASFSLGCCSALKLETKFIALEKFTENIVDAGTN
ncbi:hypothetical protein [Acinetobacter sp. ANC 4169]|nr:hypothetical protein [Acinetobacter sp. ANC 4169]